MGAVGAAALNQHPAALRRLHSAPSARLDVLRRLAAPRLGLDVALQAALHLRVSGRERREEQQMVAAARQGGCRGASTHMAASGACARLPRTGVQAAAHTAGSGQRAAPASTQHPAPSPVPRGAPPHTHLVPGQRQQRRDHHAQAVLVQRHQLEGQALAAACGRATGWVDRPAASGAQPPVAQHPPVGRMTRQSRPLSVAATASACSGRKALWPQCRCITLCSAAARCGGAGGAASAAVAAGTDSPRGAISGGSCSVQHVRVRR